MGLLTSYGANNRVVFNDKVVTYSRQRIYGQWTYVMLNVETTRYWVWEYHRYCSKSYMYVGMDLATAQSCAQAMVTKYTRSTKISVWQDSGSAAGTFIDEDGGTVCMADISIQQQEGHMYSVVVNVREDDVKLRTYSTTPSGLFTTENQRDYDT